MRVTSATRRIVAAAALIAAAGVVAASVRGCGARPGVETGVDVPGGAGSSPLPSVRRSKSRAHVAPELPADAVRATVRSVSGEPIAGAVVEIFPGPAADEICDDDNFRPSAKPAEPLRTIAADARGAALFDGVAEGRWFVTARAPGYGRRSINATRGARGTEAEVYLAPGVPFGGTLRDEADRPISATDVILAPTQRSMVWPSDAACLRTTTDAEGTWGFDAVSPGEYRVWVRAAPDTVVDEGRVRVPSLDRFDIRLLRGASVEGTVTDADTGRPLSGARVEIRSDDWEVPSLGWTTCDASGRFAYLTHLAEADVNSVRVDAGGYAPIAVEDSGGIPLKHPRDGQTVRLAVRVRRGFVVTGVVTGPEGPLVGADVKVVPDSEKDAGFVAGRQTRTDAAGRYRLERVPGGPATVFVSPFGATRYWDTDVKVPVLVGESPVASADIEVPARRVLTGGRVVDRDGNPIAGASVTYESGPLASSTVTGDDGRYSLGVWVSPGQDYPALVMRADGFGRGGASVPADGGEAEEVQLGPLESDRGAVLDADGKPVAGARVVVESGEVGQEVFIYTWPGAAETVTDARGAFEMTASTGDEYLIHAYSPGVGTTWNWRNWDPGGDATHDISLRRVVRAKGRVVDAETHDPVANALVRYPWYANQEDPPLVGRTDAGGRFDVPYEPAEEKEIHSLRVVADEFLAETVTPGAVEVVVELRSAFSITGTLVDADGRAIAGQSVGASQAGVSDDVAARDSCTTDSDGRFVFTSLPAGRYEIAASAKGHEFEDVSAEVTAGTRDVVLKATKPPAPDESR